MGLCSSTPLPKIKNKSPVFLNPVVSQSTAELPKEGYSDITSFVLNNEKPVMYDWIFKEEIGSGSMSHVFLVENLTNGDSAAAKVYSLAILKRKPLDGDAMPIVAVQGEIDILAALVHPHILRIIDVFEDDPTRSLVIITDYASLGSVQKLYESQSLTEDMIMTCFYQIASALAYMHKRNIVHRDIKPENILAFAENFFVLSDFSVSRKLVSVDEKLNDTKGSPAFLSPEECTKNDFAPKPADVWAYGVSLYMVLFKELPFKIGSIIGNTIVDAMHHVSKNLEEEALEFPENANQKAIDLISKLLAKNPDDRPAFEDITLHPFFDKARENESKITADGNELYSSKYGDTSEGSFQIAE